MAEHGHIRRPSLEDFIYEGEGTPLLLRKGVILGIAAGFAVTFAAYFIISELYGFSYTVDAEPLRDWVERRGVWGPIGFILIMALSVLFAPIPNVPIFIAAGLVWGPVVGTIYSMAGMMLGSTLAFYAARWLGRKHLARLIGGRGAARLDGLTQTMGGRLIFAARMMPIVNFDWISMVAGLTAIRFWPFFFWSFVGMLLPTTLAVVSGEWLERNLWVTLGIGGLWVLGLVLSAAYFWHRQRRWRPPNPSADPAAP
ncbi:MAG: TVP38/TMEM64 family protein [Dehalococcoidia bacterium]